jgi:putative endonuclease
MFHVYVLKSNKTGRRYVGSCEDFENRLRRHNNGESKATKHGIPWSVLRVEAFKTRAAAVRKECYSTGYRAVATATHPDSSTTPPFSMKSATVALVMALGMGFAAAQEPPLPEASTTPAASPTARPELNIPDIPMTVEPSPLVPSTSPAPAPKKNLPSLQELDTVFQHSSLGAAVEEQRLHLEWRKLKNRTVLDSEVVAAKKAADSARTDEEKRNLLRAYYKIFYAHMAALAETPEIKGYLEQKKRESLNALAQPHIRPEPTARPTAKP